jgi:hypothetical protein
MVLQYLDIKFLLLYFPTDSAFEISPIEETSWTSDTYNETSDCPTSKIRLTAKYEGKMYSAILVQCGASIDQLLATMNYLVRLKQEKKTSIENILQFSFIPRVYGVEKRTHKPSLKVVNSLFNANICLLVIDT